MYYSEQAPEGASEFETAFGLVPLGEEVTAARLARLEAIAGLFISAAVSGSDRASVWVGSFFPSQSEVPVPSEQALGQLLDGFRTAEESHARHEAYYADFND